MNRRYTRLKVKTVYEIEVAAKWKPATDRQLAKRFVYICENSRELWHAASWEGLPDPCPIR